MHIQGLRSVKAGIWGSDPETPKFLVENKIEENLSLSHRAALSTVGLYDMNYLDYHKHLEMNLLSREASIKESVPP
jgi:hypothetical protein